MVFSVLIDFLNGRSVERRRPATFSRPNMKQGAPFIFDMHREHRRRRIQRDQLRRAYSSEIYVNRGGVGAGGPNVNATIAAVTTASGRSTGQPGRRRKHYRDDQEHYRRPACTTEHHCGCLIVVMLTNGYSVARFRGR